MKGFIKELKFQKFLFDIIDIGYLFRKYRKIDLRIKGYRIYNFCSLQRLKILNVWFNKDVYV